jgi:hypothetical protein
MYHLHRTLTMIHHLMSLNITTRKRKRKRKRRKRSKP